MLILLFVICYSLSMFGFLSSMNNRPVDAVDTYRGKKFKIDSIEFLHEDIEVRNDRDPNEIPKNYYVFMKKNSNRLVFKICGVRNVILFPHSRYYRVKDLNTRIRRCGIGPGQLRFQSVARGKFRIEKHNSVKIIKTFAPLNVYGVSCSQMEQINIRKITITDEPVQKEVKDLLKEKIAGDVVEYIICDFLEYREFAIYDVDAVGDDAVVVKQNHYTDFEKVQIRAYNNTNKPLNFYRNPVWITKCEKRNKPAILQLSSEIFRGITRMIRRLN